MKFSASEAIQPPIALQIDKLLKLSNLNPSDSVYLAGLYILMVGYFEKYIHSKIASLSQTCNIDELRLYSVLNNVKLHLSMAKDIKIADLKNWYANPSDNFSYTRFSERLDELEICLPLLEDTSKQRLNRMIRDFKHDLKRRNQMAHGEDEAISTYINIEIFRATKDRIFEIIEIIDKC